MERSGPEQLRWCCFSPFPLSALPLTLRVKSGHPSTSSEITITGIDITMTSLSETLWIRVPPPPRWPLLLTDPRQRNTMWAERAGRAGDNGGGVFLALVTQLERRSTNKRILCPKWLPCKLLSTLIYFVFVSEDRGGGGLLFNVVTARSTTL